VTCPNCGAALRVDVGRDCLACEYCRTIHIPEPDSDGVRVLSPQSDVTCPVCLVPLAEASLLSLPVAFCGSCHGLLAPVALFGELVGSLRQQNGGPGRRIQPVDQAQLDRQLTCPGCGRTMDTHVYGGPGNVVIDNCPRCEVNWLDHGELQRIAGAPDPPPMAA
jgi:Zn-finger nucleic acid-binding protein